MDSQPWYSLDLFLLERNTAHMSIWSFTSSIHILPSAPGTYEVYSGMLGTPERRMSSEEDFYGAETPAEA